MDRRGRHARFGGSWRARGARIGASVLAVLAWLSGSQVAAQVTFVGAGAQAASETAGTITPALPAGTAAGDVAVLVVAGRPSDSAVPAAPAGWTLRSSVLNAISGNDLRLMTFYRVLAGGDGNPVLTLPTTWEGTAAGISGQIAVWRGVDGGAPFDVADVTSTATAAASFTAPAITTANADAMVVSVVASGDNNDLGLGTANGFTARMSGTSFHTTLGGDHAVALADEVQGAAGAVVMAQWSQNNSSSDPWAAVTFALRRYVPPPTERLSFSFEETSWSSAAGQVADDGPYNLDGTAVSGATTANTSPALTTNPGTCRYGSFDGTNDYIEVPDNAALDISSELTIAAWIYMRSTPSELHTIVSKDTNYEYHIDSQRRLYWWWNDTNGNTRSITTTTQIALNQWYHVAVTYRSGAQRLYINGVQQATTGNYTGTLITNNLPFYVGTDWQFLDRSFDGHIDEVRVIADELSQSEIQALRDETHPCANSARFTITHNAFGIHCLAETITVNVVDATAGTPLVNYNAPVQLDTQSGNGTWALVAGSGTFSDGTAGDGVATYTWPLGQSQATFTLYYPQGPPAIDVDVFQTTNTGIRDDDAEGTLTFSPNGFSVTAAALANPPGAVVPFATNQTAGTNFTLYIAAYGQLPGDSTCGIIETYTGAKNLKFWSQYVNPGTGTRNATINGTAAAASEAAATAQSVTFANGQASVTAKYKDVGQIRLALKDDTTGNVELPNGIRGATTNFVVRPYDFLLSNIANAANTVVNPQAVDASGAVFLAAGAPFRATVTVRDAEGSTTPNYGRETIPETVRLATQIVAPASGAAPAVGATAGFGAFSNGVATGTDFTWSEVGIMRLVPGIGDGSYLAAGDVTGPASQRVGRFIPSRFVASLNSPLFATTCVAGGFTYQGQPFNYATAPVLTATAVSVSGATTTNYTGSFFKLTNATLTGRSYTAAATLDTSGLPATSADPVIASPSGGVATLTFGGGAGLSLVKSAPQAPFQAGVRLAINVVDADGVVAVGAAPLGNPVTFGAATGIPFNAGQEIRYGRIRIGTAAGSERIDLPVPMRAEYFVSGAVGFVGNSADSCSANVSLALAGFTEGLAAGETCIRDSGAPGNSGSGCLLPTILAQRYREPPAGGDFNLRLAAPGPGNQGGVSIDGNVPSWLRFDWNTSVPGDEQPAGQATFGVFGGEPRQIYTREVF